MPGELLQRLAVIAANEAEQFVKAHGGVIPVKHPQGDGSHSGELQAIENLVDHIEGIAVATPTYNQLLNGWAYCAREILSRHIR